MCVCVGGGEGPCVGGFSGGGGRGDSSSFFSKEMYCACVYICVYMRVCTGEEVVVETRY